eukprot:TRINITY_DN11426_c0_g2_i1.p1 TRINITY_DN11426_c0_g2~~TRINITY_DN11426_c0_g2_i1.p1  ORF type:complete len:1253 (+),score=303.70 TRINITY_DN11426_c0_g2_i1:70-3828(+)
MAVAAALPPRRGSRRQEELPALAAGDPRPRRVELRAARGQRPSLTPAAATEPVAPGAAPRDPRTAKRRQSKVAASTAAAPAIVAPAAAAAVPRKRRVRRETVVREASPASPASSIASPSPARRATPPRRQQRQQQLTATRSLTHASLAAAAAAADSEASTSSGDEEEASGAAQGYGYGYGASRAAPGNESGESDDGGSSDGGSSSDRASSCCSVGSELELPEPIRKSARVAMTPSEKAAALLRRVGFDEQVAVFSAGDERKPSGVAKLSEGRGMRLPPRTGASAGESAPPVAGTAVAASPPVALEAKSADKWDKLDGLVVGDHDEMTDLDLAIAGAGAPAGSADGVAAASCDGSAAAVQAPAEEAAKKLKKDKKEKKRLKKEKKSLEAAELAAAVDAAAAEATQRQTEAASAPAGVLGTTAALAEGSNVNSAATAKEEKRRRREERRARKAAAAAQLQTTSSEAPPLPSSGFSWGTPTAKQIAQGASAPAAAQPPASPFAPASFWASASPTAVAAAAAPTPAAEVSSPFDAVGAGTPPVASPVAAPVGAMSAASAPGRRDGEAEGHSKRRRRRGGSSRSNSAGSGGRRQRRRGRQRSRSRSRRRRRGGHGAPQYPPEAWAWHGGPPHSYPGMPPPHPHHAAPPWGAPPPRPPVPHGAAPWQHPHAAPPGPHGAPAGYYQPWQSQQHVTSQPQQPSLEGSAWAAPPAPSASAPVAAPVESQTGSGWTAPAAPAAAASAAPDAVEEAKLSSATAAATQSEEKAALVSATEAWRPPEKDSTPATAAAAPATLAADDSLPRPTLPPRAIGPAAVTDEVSQVQEERAGQTPLAASSLVEPTPSSPVVQLRPGAEAVGALAEVTNKSMDPEEIGNGDAATTEAQGPMICDGYEDGYELAGWDEEGGLVAEANGVTSVAVVESSTDEDTAEEDTELMQWSGAKTRWKPIKSLAGIDNVSEFASELSAATQRRVEDRQRGGTAAASCIDDTLVCPLWTRVTHYQHFALQLSVVHWEPSKLISTEAAARAERRRGVPSSFAASDADELPLPPENPSEPPSAASKQRRTPDISAAMPAKKRQKRQLRVTQWAAPPRLALSSIVAYEPARYTGTELHARRAARQEGALGTAIHAGAAPQQLQQLGQLQIVAPQPVVMQQAVVSTLPALQTAIPDGATYEEKLLSLLDELERNVVAPEVAVRNAWQRLTAAERATFRATLPQYAPYIPSDSAPAATPPLPVLQGVSGPSPGLGAWAVGGEGLAN